MVKDLACGMGVEENDPQTFTMVFRGRKYYFCSANCLLLFSRAPQGYVNHQSEQKSMVKDVVCGMEIDKNNAPFMTGHNRTVYYFCSDSCRQEFLYDPEQFVEKA